ncbi:MAG: hypothetical protein NTW87_19750 [Planctomycetota bacterium]|nr:hypothetical protein [Planctomycetota bacterium]
MLLIGIDEAGYGPKLGPLCHGYCALRCPDEPRGAPPDLWAMLHPAVMRHPASPGSVTVDDSKKIYAGAGGRDSRSRGSGLDLLARGVSAFLCGMGVSPMSAPPPHSAALYDHLLPDHDRRRLEEDPWGRHATPPPAPRRGRREAPAEGSPGGPASVHAVRDALQTRRVRVLALGARALSARHFNAAVQSGRNKAEVSWGVIAEQLRGLLALAEAGESIHAVVDRQGGRKFYAGNVGPLFPGAMAWVEAETPRASVYRIEAADRVARIAFVVNAESEALPVALSSMTAKLVRELCMQRFNAFFRSHLPALAPTAGYPGDAVRFLNETRSLRQALAIPDDALIRIK